MAMPRAFYLFLMARGLGAIAAQGASVAIGWLVYDVTGSALSLGLIGLVQFLPMLVLTFFSGYVADQYDRRRIVLTCFAIEAVVIGAMAWAIAMGDLPLWGIYMGVAVLGAAQAFERPAMSAILPAIVPPELLQRAVTNFTSTTQVAMIVGPAAGGVLYGFGRNAPFMACTCAILIAACGMLAVRTPPREIRREKVGLSSLAAGITFIRSQPAVFGTISLDMCAVLLGGAVSLMPIYARDILQGGPFALGLLRMSPALGALAMSLALARWPITRRVGPAFLWSIAAFGLITIVFAFSRHIWLSIALLAALGAVDTISVIIRSALVQIHTPDEMRGRVNAVNMLFIGTSNQLGDFEAGALASLVGPVAAVAFGGAGTVAMVGLWARMFPRLRRLDTVYDS